MKKIIIASICGFCMLAGCIFTSVSGGEASVAGAGSYTVMIH